MNEKSEIVNGTKTDALKRVVNDELERRRKSIDSSFWAAQSTIAIIVRLRGGKPHRISFRTEDEVNL